MFHGLPVLEKQMSVVDFNCHVSIVVDHISEHDFSSVQSGNRDSSDSKVNAIF